MNRSANMSAVTQLPQVAGVAMLAVRRRTSDSQGSAAADCHEEAHGLQLAQVTRVSGAVTVQRNQRKLRDYDTPQAVFVRLPHASVARARASAARPRASAVRTRVPEAIPSSYTAFRREAAQAEQAWAQTPRAPGLTGVV